jgi:hypothetical protein
MLAITFSFSFVTTLPRMNGVLLQHLLFILNRIASNSQVGSDGSLARKRSTSHLFHLGHLSPGKVVCVSISRDVQAAHMDAECGIWRFRPQRNPRSRYF